MKVPPRVPAPRGFTLLEIVVAVTISIILSAAAMSVLLTARRQQAEGGSRAEMARHAQVVLDLFSHDMRFVGVGVPFGTCAEPAGACNGNDLLPTIRRAQPRSMVFFGDLPYPNAELNGAMALVEVVDVAAGQGDLLKVTSELSGSCTPPTTGASGNRVCDTRQFSSLTLNPGTATPCNQANPGARTCPWGMKKLQPGAGGQAAIQIIDTAGQWYERSHSASFSAAADGDLQWGGQKVRLDLTGLVGAVGLPVGAAGVGSYVVTIDRVFWTIEEAGSPGTPCGGGDCVIKRNQCWGAILDPDQPQVPSFANTGFTTASGAIDNCAGLDGTGWETIATGVTDASLEYLVGNVWQSAATTDADAQAVRAVRLILSMARTTAAGQTLQQTWRQDYFLDNRDTP